jgi:diguanylate cyclase (GGDEF)-like protein/PAS domain S-box-containing protein
MGKGSWRGETAGRRKNGTIFPQEVSLALTGDGGVVSIVRDISERKGAETTLKHLSSFPALNPNPVIEITFNGDVTYANPAALKVLESIGKDKGDISLFFPDDLKRILSEWSGDGEKFQTREVEVAGRVFSETIHFVQSMDVARIYANDITRQKQIEQQLKSSEEGYRQFTNLTSDFVHICSRTGVEPFRIQWTGGALNSISGYSSEDIFALGCFIPFVHIDDRRKVSSELNRLVPGEVKILDFRIVTKQGQVRWLAQKCRCEKGAGEGELLLYGSIRDITDRKQMEETLHNTFSELQRHDNRMRILHEMNDKLLSVESRKEVCAVIIDSAAKLFPEYSGLLAICPENSCDFKIVASWGNDFDMNATFTMNDCWALQGKESHKVCDPTQSLGCKIFQGKNNEPHFCLPLMARGETLGLLQIISPDNVSKVHLDEMYDFAITMSETISLALSNLMLREALREEAIRDPLTGLFNRRYLEETLPLSLKHHQRSNDPLTVAMLDLDHFKSFNDKYGHEAGDVVLKEVGALLRSSLRGDDIACRYGGEELLIILAGATLEHALPRMENIRQMIMNHCIHSSGRKLPAVTVSIGISEASPCETDAASILKRADIALYKAKQNGRNRIMTA